jgi:hypothetical protein
MTDTKQIPLGKQTSFALNPKTFVSFITLAKGNRIILDALLMQPVYCASPVRISDRVCILRHEYSVQIKKEMFKNDAATDRAKFGVYFLDGCVERLDDNGGAV